MEVITLKIDELTPYENNAKEHPQEQIDQIKESIRLFGMNDPIGVWGDENIIVEGHGRLLACQELGIEEVPCIRLDHLTDEERKAYTLAHNKINMNSGFNIKTLDTELLSIQDIDMEQFGLTVIDEDIIGSDDWMGDQEKVDVDDAGGKVHICPKCGMEFED